jgi:pyridinium-3,5-biscarboxylic acid mononucleotide sulfurtransferase
MVLVQDSPPAKLTVYELRMMNKISVELHGKYENLQNIFREMGSALIAMSGGVDSVVMAKVACDVLGDRALAVTADSPSLPRRELDTTVELARDFNIRHRVIQTNEFQDQRYVANPTNRCYFCKDELFNHLDSLLAEEDFDWVCYGENLDDQGDYRPGGMAAQEHLVRAPLKEAGFDKNDVRGLARFFGLPIWDKPASACLASRIPYGQQVTAEKLTQVEDAENYLSELGFRQFRVRHHGEIARIELDPEQMPELLEHAARVNARLKELGFMYVAMDLTGYRRGSLNEGIVATLEDL